MEVMSSGPMVLVVFSGVVQWAPSRLLILTVGMVYTQIFVALPWKHFVTSLLFCGTLTCVICGKHLVTLMHFADT